MIGTSLTHYQITAKLGEGGMGEVYRATDTKLGREVAIKVLPASFSRDPQSLARFEREARALASLNHPHIAAIYGFDAEQSTHFLVLELVEGETLAERLRRGPLPLKEALTVARQIAEALQEAHEKGIIHRDLKPGNVKVTPNGRVKVLDFGLAKLEARGQKSEDGGQRAEGGPDAATRLESTEPGRVMGTPAYMSPEQARGQEVDKRTDVWAFGCCLYECLSGRKPFQGKTASDLMAEVLKSEPDWSQIPQETPSAVVTLLRRCLEKESSRRLSSLGDIAITLDESTHGPSASSSPDTLRLHNPPSLCPSPTGAPGKWLWPMAAGVLIFIVGVVVFLWKQTGSDRQTQTGAGAASTNVPGVSASVQANDQKSIAVLAFANLSEDKGNEYFSDGISEELLNVLAKTPGLKVTARTSAFYFKGKQVPVAEIALQLGVAYVVEGSVRKAGDKVRITAQLIKAADGFHVWGDTFTRDLKDIFAVQDEIAGLIAKNLELKMGIGEAGARQAVSPEAYQEYLLGRAAAAKAGTADMRQAVTHFDRAVALEPKYTTAWVQLASAHTRLGRWGGASTLKSWAAARSAIDRARALEPDSPDVLLALGWILRTGEWNWREAERAFRRAIALQPNQPEILAGAAVLFYNIGQTEEAFRLARQAIQLDPLNAGTQIDLSIMFFMNKNWAEAERSARRALQLAPGGTSYHCILAWSLIAQQRYPEAEAEINLDNTEDGVDRAHAFGLLAILRGQDKVARDWLARQEEIARTNGDLADLQMDIAWLNTSLGEKDRAFAALERAYASRDPSMAWLLNSWWLHPLISDPRWPLLVRKFGLADDQLK